MSSEAVAGSMLRSGGVTDPIKVVGAVPSDNGPEEWSGIRLAQGLRFTGTTTGVYIPHEEELYSSRNRVQDYHNEYVGDW